MASSPKGSGQHSFTAALTGKGKLSWRFRCIFILLFTITVIAMLSTMIVMSHSIISKVSADYAIRFAISSADTFSTHVQKELGLLAKAAKSKAVVQWFSDADDPLYRAAAYEELSAVVDQLYSTNMYVGIAESSQEFFVAGIGMNGDVEPVALFDRGSPDDSWFYDCLGSDYDYILSVNMDHIRQKKRIWLDYKISIDGVPVGVLCTGLDFAHILQMLFSHSDDSNMRNIIIDENGVVLMDSDLAYDEDYLYHDIDIHVNDAFVDPGLLADVEDYLAGIDGYFDGGEKPFVVSPSTGLYRHVTVTPIGDTKWSSVVLYNSTTLLGLSGFIPAFVSVLLLMLGFTLAVNAFSYRLIFRPLDELIASLSRMREDPHEPLYGLARDDEFGSLSQTISDLFTKANYDALTGVYNRRFMETLLQQNMEYLSRSGATLSVLMMDIDFFKHYNDHYGHQAGDHCLAAVAKALSNCVTRASDFVARYGGEEFLAVLPNTDEAGARVIAEKMLESVRALDIPHEYSEAGPVVTISAGVTTGQVSHTQSMASYIKAADDALYASKQSGRNKYTFAAYKEPDV